MAHLLQTRLLRLTAMLLLAGCNQTPSASTSSAPASNSSAATPTVSSPSGSNPTPQATPDPDAKLISAEGIGVARLGMTLGELKQKLGTEAQLTPQSPFMVDFDAIAVRQDGQVQYYILYLAGQPFGDRDSIQGLMTSNPNYKTEKEVGSGTLLTQAEAAYGKATLSYNTQNESREYARFERQPAPNLSFGTGNASQQPAGIYPTSTGEYHETRQFRPDAAINSVLVVCLSQGCATTP
jgi:hypothetical protein